MPMLECAKTKGPCSVKPPPEPPPCPPPPRKPFPWKKLLGVISFFAAFGVVYKLFIWQQEREKLSESKPIWRPRRRIKRPYHATDLPACVQYLIVGAGIAGWSAYKAIMEHDKTAKVFFITNEDITPYKRPPMSKNMWWNNEPPDIRNLNYLDEGARKTMFLAKCNDFMDAVKFYTKETGPAVSIASGWCVLRVDAEEHIAYVKTMEGEQPIYYERCLLALGSKPRRLKAFESAPKEVREKVCTLRTIRDLEIAYRKVQAAKHVVVIGGGPLGSEIAFSLARRNVIVDRDEEQPPLEVVHVVKDKGILGGILPEYLSEWAAERLKCEGITFVPSTQVYDAFLSKDGRLELTLSNGKSLVTDYAFVAVGADPRTDIAEPSFLEVDDVNGGFLVNTELEARTHLYVAGDAASFYSQWKDTRLRTAHYLNAMQQGEIAGSNMTGFWLPCNMEPTYWVRLGDQLQIQVVGEAGACLPIVGLFKQCPGPKITEEMRINKLKENLPSCYETPPKDTKYQYTYHEGLLFYLQEDIVVGITFINLPPIEDRLEVATELLRARPSYKEIELLAELLGFHGADCVYKRDDLIGRKAVALGDTTPKKESCPVITRWRDS